MEAVFTISCIEPNVSDSWNMVPSRIIHLDGLDALRAAAGAWDDLWQRSEATSPSLRAELVAQWVEHFSRPEDFHAIALETEGCLTAAIPFVRRKVGHLIWAGAIPCNEWSSGGGLLLDVDADLSPDALASAIQEVPWSLLWLDEVVPDAPSWRQTQEALARAGMTIAEHSRWQAGCVPIDHDWPAYRERWSRKHRQKMAWAARRLAARGEVRFVLRRCFEPGDVAHAMQQCFEIENLGWKGAAGTSILRTPGMADFFIRQAEQAAEWGQLCLATLHCADRQIAFSYGLAAKGVFHSMKVGYDPEFANQVPGQLLRYYLLELLFSDPSWKAIDFQGPMTEAHAAWLPNRYTIARVAVAPGRLAGYLAVRAYRDFWPIVRNWRRKKRSRE